VRGLRTVETPLTYSPPL